jgi:nucleotide-binding universal stress UspA family protein
MPRHTVVPTDFSESASFALDAVVRLFANPSGEKLNITLLHAWQPLVEYADMYAAMPPPNPYVGTEEQATEMLERLAAKARTQSVNVTPVVRQGYPTKVIMEGTEAVAVEFVAMGTYGHSGLARFMLGSVAERVVHRVRCPVLTINSATVEAAQHARVEQMAVAAT